MVVKWDFTFVKAYDEHFAHCFPSILVGGIFKDLKRRLIDREFVHVIQKRDSSSYCMHGLCRSHRSKWGDLFPPATATPSNVYRECAEEHSSWIDAGSHILYYKQDEHHVQEYVYDGVWHVFAGSNPIPRTVQCSEAQFLQFTMAVREKYIDVVCNSATVCLVDNGFVHSKHKVSHPT